MSYLSGIASYVGTQENYSVSISPERALYAPNSTGTAFSTAGMLKSVTATGPGDGYPNLGYSWNGDWAAMNGGSGQSQNNGDGIGFDGSHGVVLLLCAGSEFCAARTGMSNKAAVQYISGRSPVRNSS